MEAFAMAGALSPESARSADELHVDPSSFPFRRVVERQWLRETSPASGLFYADIPRWIEGRRRIRKVALILILVSVFLGVLIASGLLGAGGVFGVHH